MILVNIEIYVKKCRVFQQKEYAKKYPWKGILNSIKQRCENINCKEYKYYGERGIENHITEEEIKFLMIRDCYWSMKKPSIDRKENDGNYTLKNC